MKNNTTVYISVLNWNKAEDTLECIEHLLNGALPYTVNIKIFVIDNGSTDTDYHQLYTGLVNLPVSLVRLEENIGFSGGHNKIMQQAIDDNVDYVWLVNNDGIALPDTLDKIITLIDSDPQCGAVSPLIVRKGDEDIVDFGGAYHKWQGLELISLDYKARDAIKPHEQDDFWLIGAAILFRVTALKQVGLFDDRFFAYFEDNEICAKLAEAGWTNRLAYDAHFLHDIPGERAPYFYYLTTRNDFFFWLKHTPKQYRRFIWLRLIDRAIYRANRLLFIGELAKSDACLLGCYDGVLGRGGRPELDRKVPLVMTLLSKLLWLYHAKHIKANKL